jgi:cyanophycinase
MGSVLVLQGGGPFVGNDALDQEVLAATSGYVAVLPTAEAFENPNDLVAAAQAWALRLGREIRVCEVYNRHDANEDHHAKTLRKACAVYVVGDSPIHLRSTLKDTLIFDALQEQFSDGLLVAAGGSAAALCDPMIDPRGGAFALGLDLISGIAMIAESETWSADRLHRTLQLANTSVAEVPTGAALMCVDGAWSTRGAVVLHGKLPN